MIKTVTSTKISLPGIHFALLLLRLTLGLLMLTHGYPKLLSFLDGGYSSFPDPLGVGNYTSMLLAVGAELVCSILLIIGAFTRLSVIPLIVTMVVAIFVIHGADPIGDKELAIFYLIGYVFILLSGPGKFSVDRLLSK